MAEPISNSNHNRTSQTERLCLVGRETRWKKGVSGNPAGRPKRSGNCPLDQSLTQWPIAQCMAEILARKLANRS